MQRLAPGPVTLRLPAGSELWLDGGHNASAARLVADYVARDFSNDLPFVLVFASLKTKSPRTILKSFRVMAKDVHTLPVPFHDHYSPDVLAKLANELGFDATANATLDEALDRVAAPSRVLIFGSLYLAGEVLRANREIPD
jgi:dihydrofolate synthase/folylpolyglutamate synthase